MSRSDYLEAAREIGCSICNDAIWWGDECVWLGDAVQQRGRGYELKTRTLEGDLYGGGAGIAIFLAKLAEFHDEPRFAEAAEGALRHAARSGRQLAEEGRLGFYSGATGIAWALMQGSRLPDGDRHRQAASDLAAMVCRGVGRIAAWDVIEGTAGIAIALPALRSVCDSELWESTGREVQDSLVEAAMGFDADANLIADEPLLTGLGHGAAGLALGLAETCRISGSGRAREAIRLLLAYEQREFCPDVDNWPDHRRRVDAEERDPRTKYMVAWCNGAAGIGLTRMSLFRQFGETGMVEEARIAMNTTQAGAAKFIETNRGNFSLCHGAAGNAEILDHAGTVLKEPAWKKTAAEVADRALERFGVHRSAWPCGIRNGGFTPGLMVGTAGIGRFYLRRAGCENAANELLIGSL